MRAFTGISYEDVGKVFSCAGTSVQTPRKQRRFLNGSLDSRVKGLGLKVSGLALKIQAL